MAAERELPKIQRQIQGLIDALKNGVSAAEVKDEMIALSERKTKLKEKLAAMG